jgi:reactive intermediate/imine deaminase
LRVSSVSGLCAVLLSTTVVAPICSAESGAELAREYREQHEAVILREFAEFLTYPNRAQDAEDIERLAGFIRDQLRSVGVASELLQVEDAPPVVYGRLQVPEATRTLGIYVHYDGQPVDPRNWTHPPFEPTLYTDAMESGGRPRPFPQAGEPVDPNWRLYARSAGDDKAPIAAMLPVLKAFAMHDLAPTSNLVFLLDGEEEAGSPHLGEYLQRFEPRFEDVDIWLFFDGPAHQSGRPQLTFGVRGAMGMEVTVYGATRNLHSGHYGNWAPDTPLRLARVGASLMDEHGRVLVEGWYDTADPVGDEELEALRGMPDYDALLKRELGLAGTEGAPATLAERLMLPALTVRGLSSGNTGELARNVIPNTATASLGIRLVRGNDPAHMGELVVRHIERAGYHVVREEPDIATRLAHPRIAKVTGGRDGTPASRTSMSNPFVQQVIAAAGAAADRAFGPGSLVLAPGMGGTLPLHLFTDVAGKPAIIVPVANHDNNQHAPDENLRIANLWYAIDLYAALLTMPSTPVLAETPAALPAAEVKDVTASAGDADDAAQTAAAIAVLMASSAGVTAAGASGESAADLTPMQAAMAMAMEAAQATRPRFLNSGRIMPTTMPFSEAVEVDDTLYLSGQIGVKPGSLELVEGGIRAEAMRTLQNIDITLSTHGYQRSDVVKCTVMLADIDEWGAFNEVYREFFSSPYPARSALGASGLALGARVEVECIAVR